MALPNLQHDQEWQESMNKLNDSGLFSQMITKEHWKEVQRKGPLYQISRYEESELILMNQRILAEAQLIGGLPKHHTEALTKKGWLLPFLLGYDQLYWKRWDYWLDILEKGTIAGSGPIPQIEWCELPAYTDQVRKMLSDCLFGVQYEGVRIDQFADWLLWGLGVTDTPPQISEKVNEHWYRHFDLALVLKYPTDYMSRLLEEASSNGYKSALGYFATPYQVTRMMTEMVMDISDREALKRKKFNEPCVGCGAMMLPASNYMLFGYAQDVSPIAIKLCIVQMMWYAPWFAINPLSNDS